MNLILSLRILISGFLVLKMLSVIYMSNSTVDSDLTPGETVVFIDSDQLTHSE